ncbi:hypothetical protein ACPWT1_17805 [Ramlibacter sp. MMS24-I3-19]|uniref:hypothetical protein n=1 Tax=Ramlibacter sp. MMS24-I3-19 TaxID=3416606 RepID=UPI003CFEF645
MRQVACGNRAVVVRRTRHWRCFLAGASLAAGAACAQGEPLSAPWTGDQAAERQRPQLSINAAQPLASNFAVPGSVDIGLQWRQPLSSQRYVDITAWRRVTPPPDAMSLIQQQDTVYGARVEMKLTSPSLKRFLADKFIGMQLDSGARIGLKKSNGNPTIYYRNQF